jgi:hypothetical protein
MELIKHITVTKLTCVGVIWSLVKNFVADKWQADIIVGRAFSNWRSNKALLPSILLSDKALLPSILLSDKALLPSILLSDKALLPSILLSDKALLPSILLSEKALFRLVSGVCYCFAGEGGGVEWACM